MSIPKYKTILYATDLSENMRPVFRHAVGLAQEYKAKVIMLHVAEPIGATGQMFLETYLPKEAAKLTEEGGLKKLLKVMKKRLEAFAEEEIGDRKASRVSDIVVVSGNAAEEIQKHAAEYAADLIVMGTHTKSGITHGLLGSTARQLIHASDRPVLVIPVNK